jgi:TolB-like protein
MFRHNAKPSPNRACAPRRVTAIYRIVACALVFLGAAFVVWQPVLAYDDQIKQLAAQLADAISKSGKKTIAVADFTDLDGNVTQLGRFLAEETSSHLAATAGAAKDFQVIDRTQLRATLKRAGLAMNGVLDPQTVGRLGDAAGVQAVVTGTLTPFADHIHLSARVLDESNSAILATSSVDIPRSKDLNDLLAEGGSSAPIPPAAPATSSAQAAPATPTTPAAPATPTAPAAATPPPATPAPPAASSAPASAPSTAPAASAPAPPTSAAPAAPAAATPPSAPAAPPAPAPAPAPNAAPAAAPPNPKPPEHGAPKPAPPAEPSLTGVGSVATDSYRVTVKSLQRYAGGSIGVTLEFTGLSRFTFQLAMVRGGTYLTDEYGIRWEMSQIDSAGIFNVKMTGVGGIWRGVSLASGTTIRTTLVFNPPGQPRGEVFSLTMLEFRPRPNRRIEILGLK